MAAGDRHREVRGDRRTPLAFARTRDQEGELAWRVGGSASANSVVRMRRNGSISSRLLRPLRADMRLMCGTRPRIGVSPALVTAAPERKPRIASVGRDRERQAGKKPRIEPDDGNDARAREVRRARRARLLDHGEIRKTCGRRRVVVLALECQEALFEHRDRAARNCASLRRAARICCDAASADKLSPRGLKLGLQSGLLGRCVGCRELSGAGNQLLCAGVCDPRCVSGVWRSGRDTDQLGVRRNRRRDPRRRREPELLAHRRAEGGAGYDRPVRIRKAIGVRQVGAEAAADAGGNRRQAQRRRGAVRGLSPGRERKARRRTRAAQRRR